jgi:NADPH-dependent 2,4-dienoyl-CoA reductase/sulfur reductase-like enzyme
LSSAPHPPLAIRIEDSITQEIPSALSELLALDEIVKVVDEDVLHHPRVGGDDLDEGSARREMELIIPRQLDEYSC